MYAQIFLSNKVQKLLFDSLFFSHYLFFFCPRFWRRLNKLEELASLFNFLPLSVFLVLFLQFHLLTFRMSWRKLYFIGSRKHKDRFLPRFSFNKTKLQQQQRRAVRVALTITSWWPFFLPRISASYYCGFLW